MLFRDSADAPNSYPPAAARREEVAIMMLWTASAAKHLGPRRAVGGKCSGEWVLADSVHRGFAPRRFYSGPHMHAFAFARA
jgi:hypothetical protein